MLAVTRINDIRNMIQQNNSVLVADLAEKYKVTEETIRRDLKKLEDQGVLTRVYGGAYSVKGVQSDVDVLIRKSVLVEEKKLIAKRALPFISNGDSIFLDCSTTAHQLAALITDYTLTVITNSLIVSQVLCKHENVHVILVGGSLHNKSMSFLGPNAHLTISNYYVDKAFLSCRSISLENGISDSNEDQGALRSIAIKRSDRSYLLVDHTKFDATSFVHIADISALSAIISDQPPERKWLELFREKNVSVITGN